MNKIINIGNKKRAIETLTAFKEIEYVPFDVRITNSHITELNSLANKNIFKKDTLYINSFTLWEIMQIAGDAKKHHHHNLTEDDVYLALSTLRNPQYFYMAKGGRFAVLTTELSHFKIPLMVIIEVNASTKNNKDANINKIVTIYPKDNVDVLIKKLDTKYILYQKEINIKK